MRLLDHVAQSTSPFLVKQNDGTLWRLTSAADFRANLSRCPLRYVLNDELVRTCVELAYSEGDELSGCLDLVRLPAEQLWVEWSESARLEALARVLPECMPARQSNVERSGVLICSERSGRAASLRTFWLAGREPCEALVAAIETQLDFDGMGLPSSAQGSLLDGGMVSVFDGENECLNDLLGVARFRVDSSWQRYYDSALTDSVAAARVASLLLGGVVFDIPILIALFLLMTIRAELVQTVVNPRRLNRKRARLGKQPLLEHVEVSAPLLVHAAYHDSTHHVGPRNGPRFHHVRGHIVRRRNTVYWRGPHWRGHLRLGQVRSRTVALRLQG